MPFKSRVINFDYQLSMGKNQATSLMKKEEEEKKEKEEEQEEEGERRRTKGGGGLKGVGGRRDYFLEYVVD